MRALDPVSFASGARIVKMRGEGKKGERTEQIVIQISSCPSNNVTPCHSGLAHESTLDIIIASINIDDQNSIAQLGPPEISLRYCIVPFVVENERVVFEGVQLRLPLLQHFGDGLFLRYGRFKVRPKSMQLVRVLCQHTRRKALAYLKRSSVSKVRRCTVATRNNDVARTKQMAGIARCCHVLGVWKGIMMQKIPLQSLQETPKVVVENRSCDEDRNRLECQEIQLAMTRPLFGLTFLELSGHCPSPNFSVFG